MTNFVGYAKQLFFCTNRYRNINYRFILINLHIHAANKLLKNDFPNLLSQWGKTKHSELCQTSKAECFMKMISNFKPLTIFPKHSILDVWQGSKYVSETLKAATGGVLEDFTGKHLCQMFSCEFCEISKNSFFYRTSLDSCFWKCWKTSLRTPQVAASDNIWSKPS